MKINASKAAVEKFKEQNKSLDYELEQLRHSTFSSIDDLLLDGETKLKTYKSMIKEIEDVLDKCNWNNKQAENFRNYLISVTDKLDNMLKSLHNFENSYHIIDKTLEKERELDKRLQNIITILENYKNLYL